MTADEKIERIKKVLYLFGYDKIRANIVANGNHELTKNEMYIQNCELWNFMDTVNIIVNDLTN